MSSEIKNTPPIIDEKAPSFSNDEKYILRCLTIAKNGLGTTAPNPMVGAVIVHNYKIIGEGFTSAYGGPHAEVNAISCVKNKSLLKEATLYVSLEPCSHFGKTPPCADLIIKNKIPRVVIGILDPNEKVAGQGVEKLKNAGCHVTIGVLKKECRIHHKRFLSFIENKRPYIILKWAQTQDGFIAPEHSNRKNKPEPYWITNAFSRQLVHQWRAEEQAILVGTNTVIVDNPKLDVRYWKGGNPIRVIIDKDLKIKDTFHVLDKSVTTIILTQQESCSRYIDGNTYKRIDFNKPLAKQICNVLAEYNITSVIIEGGTQTLQTFINEGLWDEARVFTSSHNFNKGLKAPIVKGTKIITRKIDTDVLNYYIQ